MLVGDWNGGKSAASLSALPLTILRIPKTTSTTTPRSLELGELIKPSLTSLWLDNNQRCGCCRQCCDLLPSKVRHALPVGRRDHSTPPDHKLPMESTKPSQRCGHAPRGLRHCAKVGNSRHTLVSLHERPSNQIRRLRACRTVSFDSWVLPIAVETVITNCCAGLAPRPRSLAARHVCQFQRSDPIGFLAHGSRCTVWSHCLQAYRRRGRNGHCRC